MKLWEILRDGKEGDKFEIIEGSRSIEGNVIELVEGECGLYISDHYTKNYIVSSDVVLNANYARLRTEVTFEEAWSEYKNGKVIASFCDMDDFDKDSPYATYGGRNGGYHESIEIDEMLKFIWEVRD